MPNHQLVENFGEGNCGYLSYGLSIAAYLGEMIPKI
ncbi:hypothetical protein PsalN5692_02771 [Piscirickettsia salmonis]|nr:hypothetical protein PsalN5692_02771 [Piscirickettsia salmonis]